MNYKVSNPKDAEIISIKISRSTYPRLFKDKVEELVTNGMLREEAEAIVEGMEVELELCYSIGNGLFAVESEAIECGASSLFNPYEGTRLDDSDEY